jgi:hypothetical protein
VTGVRSRARWVASATAATSITLTVIAIALLALNGHGLLSGFNPHLIIVGTLYAAIGWLIATRMPANRIGWLILAGSLSWTAAFFTDQYAWFAVITRPGPLPLGVGAAWVATWVWIPGTGLVLAGVSLLFPGGRLRSRRWSPVVFIAVIGVITATVAQAIGLWPQGDGAAYVRSDPNASLRPDLIGAVASVGMLLTIMLGPLAGTVAVALRLRDARGVEHLQMRWFAYAMGVTVVTSLLDEFAAPAGGWPIQPSIVAIALIPIAIGMAILRYRLYEIDRIISRTVSYGAVTGILAVVFVGTILISQTIFASFFSGSSVAVAASTLVVAALFQPLRRRVQSIVDRRFNRSRYDAERTVAAFGAGLRNEVALADVDAAIRTVVAQTVAPTAVGLWVRERGRS